MDAARSPDDGVPSRSTSGVSTFAASAFDVGSSEGGSRRCRAETSAPGRRTRQPHLALPGEDEILPAWLQRASAPFPIHHLLDAHAMSVVQVPDPALAVRDRRFRNILAVQTAVIGEWPP